MVLNKIQSQTVIYKPSFPQAGNGSKNFLLYPLHSNEEFYHDQLLLGHEFVSSKLFSTFESYIGTSDGGLIPQSAITCSNLTLETLEQGVKYVQS